MNPDTGAHHARAMLRWRRRALVPLVPFSGAAVVLLGVHASLPNGVLYALAGLTVILGLALLALSVPVIRHLFLYAQRRGGPRYASSHAVLAALLVPVAYLGVVALPLLLISDHASRLPQWRQRTALGLELEFLRFGGFLGALAGAGLLSLIPGMGGLVLAALWLVAVILGTTHLVRRLRIEG